jgi:uncharacterized membrane protein YqaE (UPF0057 family)
MAMNPHPTHERTTAHHTSTIGQPVGARRSTITVTDPIKILFAILLPPLGVFFEVGFKGHFWLNIVLTLLGYVPGIIHAIYVILRH